MYRYLGLFVIISIIIGVALFGGFKNEKTEERINGAKEVELFEVNNIEEKENNSNESTSNSENIVEPVIQEKEVNEIKEESKTTEKTINNQKITEEIKTNDNQVVEEPKESIDKPIEDVDLEYERLKSLCETFDYNKCYKKASEVSSTDIENIRNTSCEDVIYKGQIIGQRIIIFYRDGTWKYNNATN